MLFCERILLEPFETGVYSREPSPVLHRGRECVPLYQEAAVPNKEFQRDEIGISCISPRSYPCVFLFLQKSPLTTRHAPHSSLQLQFVLHSKLSPPCLPDLASVYGQCMVTVCQLVTECRPASEGLGPAYKTTHWLQGDYSHCVREREKAVSVCGAYITDKLYYVC